MLYDCPVFSVCFGKPAVVRRRAASKFVLHRPAFDTIPVDLVSGFQIWFSQMKWNFSGIVSGVEPDEGTLVV